MTQFSLGETYTRDEIHAEVGGGVQDYLPHVAGAVVAGCFNPELNPDAPDVILPGTGPGIEKWALVMGEQREPVPCFLKRWTNAWEYVGKFYGGGASRSPDDIARYAASTGRLDVSMVLFLKESHD